MIVCIHNELKKERLLKMKICVDCGIIEAHPEDELCEQCLGEISVVVSNDSDTELDLLRKDLLHQLGIPDELDWDYFLETAMKAKAAADVENRNMVSK